MSTKFRPLLDDQIQEFVSKGFIRVDNAFDSQLATKVREILWRDLKVSREDSEFSSQPVIRLGMYTDAPFVEAANSESLVAAYNSLAGEGCWLAPKAVGTFPVRFPSPNIPNDTGWHVDMSLDFHNPDFMQWRVNINSDGRLLLMLFLFSDVSDQDAPTKLRVGSHMKIARQLFPYGKSGLTLAELAKNEFRETENCIEALATGAAGTVYLCHPFIVHSAQAHQGQNPKFMAQPPLLPKPGLCSGALQSPVQVAIRKAHSPSVSD